jgi:hypothetical protein
MCFKSCGAIIPSPLALILLYDAKLIDALTFS